MKLNQKRQWPSHTAGLALRIAPDAPVLSAGAVNATAEACLLTSVGEGTRFAMATNIASGLLFSRELQPQERQLVLIVESEAAEFLQGREYLGEPLRRAVESISREAALNKADVRLTALRDPDDGSWRHLTIEITGSRLSFEEAVTIEERLNRDLGFGEDVPEVIAVIIPALG